MAADREVSLRFACPLEHPPDYAVAVVDADGDAIDVPVPKERGANLDWRREIIEAAEHDPEMQSTIRAMCAAPGVDGCLLFINLFCWTYLQSKVDETGRQRSITTGDVDEPFITWPIQDRVVAEAIRDIEEGDNLVIEKSREMGASWIVLAVFLWMAIFRPGTNFMLMSRVEELVDNPGDPDSLLWKIDYMVGKLPTWARPLITRRTLFWANKRMRTTIIGKSTTARQGRAGRKTAVFVDEAAMIDVLKRLWMSLRYTTKCIIAASTPDGPGYFAQLCRSSKVRKVQMPWWAHPVKGAGRYEKRAEDGSIEIRSPWLDNEEEHAESAVEIAQELGMDHTGGGSVVFPPKIVQLQKSRVLPPLYMGTIAFVGEGERDIAIRDRTVEDFAWVDAEESGAVTLPWKLWCELERDEQGQWRPPQNRTYAAGIDVSWGLGRSNSTFVVVDVETGEVVGSASDANVDPTEWGELCAMWGLWWGGQHGCACLCPEANGGGGQLVVKALKRLVYPWLFFEAPEGKKTRKPGITVGWHSNDSKKAMVAGLLRRAMGALEVLIRDEDILAEMDQWIFYDGGGLGPSTLVGESRAATATHGDRVIGAMLAHYCRLQCFRCNPPTREEVYGSRAWRAKRRAEKRGEKGPLPGEGKGRKGGQTWFKR